MTGETRLRRCQQCGERFRSAGEEYCSTICTAAAAQLAILDGLRRFAQQNPPRTG